METMRLGYLVPQFPGQTHIFFWREIQHLERLGARVGIVSTRPPPRRLMAHSWTAEAMARTTYLGAPRAGGTLRRLPGLPFRDADVREGGGRLALELVACADPAQRLLEVCSASGITHLHVHSCGRAALTACLARRSGGPPYSLTLHGPLGDYGPGQRLKWRHAAFATIITRRLVAEVEAELGAALTRTVVQPMGVDTDVFARPSPYRPVKPGEPLRLFSCGRLNRVKGHQDLLAAVRLLLDRGRDVRLTIASNGARTIVEEIRRLGAAAA